MMTSRKESPRVSGTNRKWYSAVAANCSREMSTSSWDGIMVMLLLRLRGEDSGGYFLVIEAGILGGGEPYRPYDGKDEALNCQGQGDLLPQSDAFCLVCHSE